MKSVLSVIKSLSLLLLAGTLAFGCSNKLTIFVSDPQVFTRERLVQERYAEHQWLEERLRSDTPQQSNIHVIIESKQKGKTKVGLEAGINRNQAKKDQGNLDKKPSVPNSLGIGENVTTNNSKTLDSNQKSQPSNEDLIQQRERIEFGILDTLHDQTIFRNAVRAAMREKQLDDRHDLFGSMLYDLQFDITLIPENLNVDTFGQITIQLQKNRNCSRDSTNSISGSQQISDQTLKQIQEKSNPYKELYEKWVHTIREHFYQKHEKYMYDFRSGAPAPSDLNFLIEIVQGKLKNKWIESWKGKEEEIAAVKNLYKEIETNDLRNAIKEGTHQPLLEKLITGAVWFRATALEKFLSVEPPSARDGELALIIDEKPIEKMEEEFQEIIENIDCKHPIASSIEPKEFAQNISAFEKKEKAFSLFASVQASLASLPLSELAAKSYFEYLRETQEYIQAINRIPLAVGFAADNGTFGWILGPKIKGRFSDPGFLQRINPFRNSSIVRFSHVPVRHTFRASVVVPGWWKDLILCVKTSPQTSKNSQHPSLSKAKTSNICPSGQIEIEVNLPKQPEWWEYLAHALIKMYPRDKPYIVYPNPLQEHSLPILYEYDKDKPATHLQSLLIQGKELWRNPQVFVGNLKAKEIEILSDMTGISALFDLRPQDPQTDEPKPTLNIPPDVKDRGRLDLVVVTSNGTERVPKSVIWRAKESYCQIWCLTP